MEEDLRHLHPLTPVNVPSVPPIAAPLRPARAALLDIVRNEFGRVVYTHKTHEKMADRLNRRLLLEKRINAFLLAATAGNSVGVMVSDVRWAELTALVFSGLALLVTVYGLSRARERLVDAHRQAAMSLWLLREKYLHLIGDLGGRAITVAEGRRRRDALVKMVHQCYAAAPATDAKAYAEAQRALKSHEEFTFSDAEIDAFLPSAIRKGATA